MLKFTTKGYIEVFRDGVLISRHISETEAVEALSKHAYANTDGNYVLKYPEKWVSTLSRIIYDTDTTAPSVPGGVSVIALSTTTLRVSWSASTDTGGSGLAGYRVYRSTASGGTYTQVGSDLSVASLSFDDTSLSASTTRYYRVSAFDGNGNESAQSAVVSGATQPGSSPGYTPLYLRDFQEGSIGNSLSNFSSSSASRPVVYSNAIAGPHGESKVAALGINNGAFNAFGGQFTNWVTVPRSTLLGNDAWIRLYHYFPSAFCASYSTQGGDGWGGIKWLRLGFAGDTARLTLELGGFASGACASTSASPTLLYLATEGVPGASSGFWWGAVGDSGGGAIIPRDQWVALQIQIHFGATTGTSYVRGWVNDNYAGQATGSVSMDDAATGWDQFFIGNYWNGGVSQTVTWYVADLIVTMQQPTTLDSGGRPYISPTARVSDFA